MKMFLLVPKTLLAAVLWSWTLSSVAADGHLPRASFADKEMVVSAHYLATEAGEEVLAAGGTAVDAMVAVQTVLGLVEPQSSGIAGGAFVVYYDATTSTLTTFDAREKAPMEATEERFIDPATGAEMGFLDAWQTALSVGVPGIPLLMEIMHGRYGNQEWASLFESAKTLATDGFPSSQRTADNANELLGNNIALGYNCSNGIFFRDPVAYEYFINEDCTAKPAGTTLTNPDYADVMDMLATEGSSAFYTGTLAEEIVAKVAADRNPTGDATISLEDLLNYEIVEREPVCYTYRSMFDVCGMGPPSSGALAVGQILGVMDNFDLSGLEPKSVDTVHLFTQAGRLAFADRNLYVGDPDFVTVPTEGMLNMDYLASRAALIDMDMDMGTATPGVPPGTFDPAGIQTVDNESGTSHISIVDQYGNAISMTTTIESFFGSGLMVKGFLLNNQITDFSFSPTDEDGTPIANRVQPSKRPRSSMSPTMVLNSTDGSVGYLTGSPGGSRIIGYTAQSLVSMLDFGLDPEEAAKLPHTQNRNGPTEYELIKDGITSEYDIDALQVALTNRSHTLVEISGETSGLSIIQVLPEDGGFLGAADPRRDGSTGGRMDDDEDMSDVPTMAPVGGDDVDTPSPTGSSAAASDSVCIGTVVMMLYVVAGIF